TSATCSAGSPSTSASSPRSSASGATTVTETARSDAPGSRPTTAGSPSSPAYSRSSTRSGTESWSRPRSRRSSERRLDGAHQRAEAPALPVPGAGMSLLVGKVAIVTGGAQGIGKAIADGLTEAGATVVIADLDPPEGGIRADVSSEADVEAMVVETVDRHGGVDILVNNAGLYASLAMRPFTEIPLEEWRHVMDVNVASMFLTCRAVVPVMRERGGGKIVNISSGTPFRGVPFLLHYVT